MNSSDLTALKGSRVPLRASSKMDVAVSWSPKSTLLALPLTPRFHPPTTSTWEYCINVGTNWLTLKSPWRSNKRDETDQSQNPGSTCRKACMVSRRRSYDKVKPLRNSLGLHIRTVRPCTSSFRSLRNQKEPNRVT
ncbi:hypothetical protein VNO77_07967 [Canavalia gladiata]|uniref:Uncharacterized protein n=1 Tax=Canavalia gladiata TaxID=3824 RepID=A0AAN9QWV8_CANGL